MQYPLPGFGLLGFCSESIIEQLWIPCRFITTHTFVLLALGAPSRSQVMMLVLFQSVFSEYVLCAECTTEGY